MLALSTLVSITLILTLLLFLLKFLISDMSYHTFSREEASSYECGFEQYSLSRIPLSIRYFSLTLVFLIFDLEIMLLMFVPNDLFLFADNTLAFSVSVLFIFILFLSLLYEWYDGALDWVM